MTVGSPSVLSTISCVGLISNAGLNVRISETVLCTFLSLAVDGIPAIAAPSDFLAPLTTGGSSLSPITATANSSVLVFTVVSPSMFTLFSVTGRLADGAPFSQGALVLTVGELWGE